jgi:sterol desaturase/sphingolipid hydroxylase (fatty acid hydroxylase superfamily)
MSVNRLVELTRYVMLPLLLIAFWKVSGWMAGTTIARVFPAYNLVFLLCALVIIERVYSYSRAISQRHVIWRDLISTTVQLFVVGAVVGAIVLPVLRFFPHTFLGRRFLFGLADQLGPLWVQVLAVFLLYELWGYWMHRFQHYNEFLWKLHSYHHTVTHLQTSNVGVSNPLDFALRNVLGVLLLSIVGFNPIALGIAGIFRLYALFSHCGGDMKGGWLNYLFNTPEVHRWHHSVEFADAEKFRYGCNFGVGVSFWDIVFGTFLLPKDETGQVIPPPRIGHPSGYADEPNYLKVLLAVRAFPAMARLFAHRAELPSVPAE